MAYLTINSTFTPYSFDELIKPFAMYDTAYREQEAYLDAARANDPSVTFGEGTIASGMYNDASNSLKTVSDELATNGLSPDLRSRIRSTVRDYNSTMKTLNSAQERLQAEQDRRLKLGSDYVFQQNNLNIDDFLNGSTPNQRGESLTDITKDIATQFSSRAQQITRDTWNKVLGSNGNVIGGYYDVTTESGLTAAQLDTILADEDTWNSIMNNSGISKEQRGLLQSFRNTITAKKNSIGYNDYDDYSRNKIDEAIIIGAHGALGGTTHKYEADRGYDPLGRQRYNDSKAQSLLELRLKYPQYQFDDEGNVITDEEGNIAVSEGWKQDDKGKWYGPNNQIIPSSATTKTGTQRYPNIKVMYFDQNGGLTRYDTDEKFNTAHANVRGDLVTKPGMLSDENKERLATIVGCSGMDSEEYILELAADMGIFVSVIGEPTESKKVKGDDGKKVTKDISNSSQQMIVRGTSSFIGNARQEDENFDDDRE